MPRSVDFSKLPPPEALCFGCGQTVALSLKARGRGRFRCPHCHNDNRVDYTGRGAPLRRNALAVEYLPEAVCPQCGAANRLPGPLLTGRRYTCFACRRPNDIPAAYRLKRRAVWPWVMLLTLAIGLASVRLYNSVSHFVNDVREGIRNRTVQFMDDSIALDAPNGLITSTMATYNLGGTARNMLAETTTLYIRIELCAGTEAVMQQTVALLAVRPGETRHFQVRFQDPDRRKVNGVRCRLLGVS